MSGYWIVRCRYNNQEAFLEYASKATDVVKSMTVNSWFEEASSFKWKTVIMSEQLWFVFQV